MVWPSIERDAMGGRGFGFWWCWCRRLDSTEREAKKERGREEEGEGGLSWGGRGGGKVFCDIIDFFFLNPWEPIGPGSLVVYCFLFFSTVFGKEKREKNRIIERCDVIMY